MSDPDLLATRVGDEDIIATVTLNGEDELVVTPSRSLVYRAEGILSDESVEEYSHDVERVDVDAGRRKSSIVLTYPIEGTRRMAVPKSSLDSVLHYLLAGVLNVKGITTPGESVQAVYRFNELTVVITSERLVTHVGEAAWDEDFEEYQYVDLTGLAIEEGSVATQFVLYIGDRSQRIKVPKADSVPLKRDLQQTLFDYFEVSSLAALNEQIGREDDDEERGADPLAFDAGVDPLGTGDIGSDPQPTEPTARPDGLSGRDRRALERAIEELEESIERQAELLETQREALEALIATLTRGR